MRKKLFLLLSLFVCALVLANCTGNVSFVKFDNHLSQSMGESPVTLTGKLTKPDGDGPFPAVVILHPCVGITENQDRWASRFKNWGYVSLQVNSFQPRGVANACDDYRRVPPKVRAQDAYDAKSYLATLPFVDGGKIAVVGWSHGASSTLYAVTLEQNYPQEKLFRAAVAFYPYCFKMLDTVNAPLLILIGEKDDWCPARKCIDNVPEKTKTGHEIILKVYPLAHHCFDVMGQDKVFYGHRLEFNPHAAADAKVQVKDFLSKYLK